MSGKIDQGLDDIIKANGRGQRRSRRVTRKTTAPTGGIKKNTKTTTTKTTTVKAKPAATTAAAAAPTKAGPSKIIVSNLPTDVTEAQIKDYFVQTIGPVKKVFLTYGPNGQSRGQATIIFSTPQAASDSAKLLNGTKVDGKPMRVEVVLGADQAPQPQVAKALAQRISQAKQQTKQPAKNQPKSAATKKVTAASTKPKKTTTRGRNANRPKRKTADELDAEMNDYWDTGATNGASAGGAVQPVANGGDAAMEDEVL